MIKFDTPIVKKETTRNIYKQSHVFDFNNTVRNFAHKVEDNTARNYALLRNH